MPSPPAVTISRASWALIAPLIDGCAGALRKLAHLAATGNDSALTAVASAGDGGKAVNGKGASA